MTRQSTFIRPKGRIPSSPATRTRMTCSATPTKAPGAGRSASYKDTHDMFSYSNKSTRSWAFVVRGLPDDMDEQELVDELTALKLELVKLYKMKKTKTPLFLVVLGSRTTPVLLNKMSAKTSIQCRKCQRWSHSASNCFAKDPKCVKCAESHATNNCRKEDSTPTKCANCGGDHPASFRGCPTHIAYQSAKDKAAAAARKQQPRNAPSPASFRGCPTHIAYQSAKDKAAAAARKQQPRNAPRRDPARSYQPAPIPAINPWRQPPSDPPQTANGAAAGTDFPPLGSTEKVTRIALSNALDARPTQPPARLTSTPEHRACINPTNGAGQPSDRTSPGPNSTSGTRKASPRNIDSCYPPNRVDAAFADNQPN
ncbi:hypothetical protein QE152_g35292 [Popillia japonica]|uniref:Nucleic-acid-binding protein from transposon X-element n=1 Tax=Popillia japonica TaxID=7064 RepID=A0AAW1IG88_POPJA